MYNIWIILQTVTQYFQDSDNIQHDIRQRLTGQGAPDVDMDANFISVCDCGNFIWWHLPVSKNQR